MKYITSIILFAFITSCGVQQNLSVSYKLSPGMTKELVETIMVLNK